MKQRVACLMAVGFVLAAGPYAAISASAQSRSVAVGDVDIMVDGARLPRYAHEGRWLVEARKGREYAIRLRNPYPVRVAVALSVDGLNSIDARETTAAAARKWVLGPYETVTISGWQTSRLEARRFEFTTEARSYGQALGKTANLGVISVVFFKERAPAIAREMSKDQAANGAPAAPSAAPQKQGAASAEAKRADDGFAATGMGRPTDHAVTQVWLDLEDAPAQTVNIRYEFRPQLVRLGILPSVEDPLQRREHAHGFEPGFSPEPPHQR